ncbi:Post-segregation antitoxin (ccd killing mechanism protein) encoded by the F plasmid [Pseudonocardia ammonioxydans]|uniref:Post-segregation antitoxin (Ccd killing mechanism protein) encoded by the F plasmid n=1 Tax=Pseudonocardia ammonioxydans TaxID=260086 RepID=A0A1I5IFU4_PSUAM|nr:type II toxin-antitoxin system CcdA family antitoxin [Pseudonocardia ammonioxydans]SFO59314.1 Post-segregation antitoxin (ccd killing mechanism protein) encoded by the F plasmid [Pseudonocardia ammonioxydans]
MARLNVWVPDELAARARAQSLNVSALTQQALAAELDRQATDTWLAELPAPRRPVAHTTAAAALDAARAEFDADPEPGARE